MLLQNKTKDNLNIKVVIIWLNNIAMPPHLFYPIA